ncbi:MAG: hypothetical protein ACK4MH_06720 [Brevundimonas sp.]|uniref:hypothetical protein n=1 Tax=Brevundimonas sp. TaxID=1871086 RepID=UPI00391C5627
MSDGLASYLLVVDSSQTALQKWIDEIDMMVEVVNWQKMLPDAAVLVSEQDIRQLNSLLRKVMPNKRYILVEIENGNKQGWLAKSAWKFMNNPKPA